MSRHRFNNIPFLLTEDDLNSISLALPVLNPWRSSPVETLRRRLIEYHKYVQDNQCCYCKRDLAKAHGLTIDPEHVVPKSAFPALMFEPVNISISCKRCNMTVKGDKVDFISCSNILEEYNKSESYSFIHPNLDEYFEHIRVVTISVNEARLIKYLIVRDDPKGVNTYDYFQLSEIEIGTFDEAQGLADLSQSETFSKLLRAAGSATAKPPSLGPVGEHVK